MDSSSEPRLQISPQQSRNTPDTESSHLIPPTSPPVIARVKCINCDESVPPRNSDDEKTVRIFDNLTVSLAPSSKAAALKVVTASPPCQNCNRNDTTSKGGKLWCRNYWGILLSLASGLASTFGGVIVKRMKGFHAFSLATYRFQGILLPALVIVLYYRFVRKENVFHTVWPVADKDKLKKFGFTIVRAVIGCFGLYLYFYAIQLMPLADAKIILSCRPVFVTYVAHIFLGEPCGIFPVAVSFVAIVGVGVISKPPILTGESGFDTDTLMGTGFATLSMLAATLSMVVLRYLRGVHVAVVTLAFGFWGTILSITCSAAVDRFDVPRDMEEWALIVCLAVATFFSQTAITLAMKYEQAGSVVIVGTCDTIMSFVLQYLFLDHVPDKFSILGAALILLCVGLVTFRKWLSSLPMRHSARKNYWYVLR